MVGAWWRETVWIYGDPVVLRFHWEGRLSWAQPVTVVEDSPSCIALYLAMGALIKRPVGADGLPVTRFQAQRSGEDPPWRLGDAMWGGHSVLWLAQPGAAHAIGLFWRGADRAFVGWYGNLQAPLQRTRIGFDTSDYVLDIDIAPDRSWTWKDEDEFTEVLQRGVFSPAEAAAVRAEGKRVIAALEQWAWPFDAGWERWQPDPAWPVPRLPEGWDAG